MSTNIFRLLPDQGRALFECNEPLAIDERAQQERFEAHRARFKERQKWAGFCRWMAGRFGTPATADKPDKPPGSGRP